MVSADYLVEIRFFIVFERLGRSFFEIGGDTEDEVLSFWALTIMGFDGNHVDSQSRCDFAKKGYGVACVIEFEDISIECDPEVGRIDVSASSKLSTFRVLIFLFFG